jgi:hypothetical protein
MEMMEKEWNLPTKEARKLIKVSGNRLVSDAGVQQAIEMSRAYNIPLRAIAFIPAGNDMIPYITADGMMWAYRIDPRGAAGIHTEIVQYPDPESSVQMVVAKAVVTFKDGSTYENYGVATSAQRANKDMDVGDLIMKALTKSVRRAIHLAVGMPFPVFEDAVEVMQRGMVAVQNRDTVDGTVVSVSSDVPSNMAILFAKLQKERNKPYLEACEIAKTVLGTEEPLSYPDPAEAWKLINEYLDKEIKDSGDTKS